MIVKRKWYAIRVGDFVEVRSTIKGIKKITSRYAYKNSDGKEVILTQTAYEGGKLHTVWDHYTWYNRFYTKVQNIPDGGHVLLTQPVFIKEVCAGGSAAWQT